MAKSAPQSTNTSPKPSNNLQPTSGDQPVIVKSRRKAVARTARNILIGIFIMVVLIVTAGVAYTWYMGKQPVQSAATIDIVETEIREPIKAATPPEDSIVGASVQSLTSPVVPGMNANIIIHTRQYATCTIVVEYNKVPSTDSGLKPKIADEFGTASWTWTVEESVPVGKWPVKVTCVYGEKSGIVIGELVVVASLEE
jgi:hypothetical protein